MKHTFRHYHLLQLLEEYDPERGPIDRFVALYFKHNRALGSKDRREIRDILYALLRWQGKLDALGGRGDWERRLEIWENAADADAELQPWERVSAPQSLWDSLVDSYGEERASALCLAMNEEAPITIRCNSLKSSREELMQRLSERFEVTATTRSPDGIQFTKRHALFDLPEFRQGHFEMQDEGSQCVAQLVQAKPGQRVLDYCAGGGGKSLAIAPAMQGKGQLFLYDIRPRALAEAKLRLRRAGVQNYQSWDATEPGPKQWKKKMDWVLVDAPCSGTGTFRRNPDMKWKFNKELVERLVSEQRVIFERALSFMKPDGRIVFATCSILPEENEKQIEHFKRTYDLEQEGESFQSFPEPGQMDGLFGVILKRKVT